MKILRCEMAHGAPGQKGIPWDPERREKCHGGPWEQKKHHEATGMWEGPAGYWRAEGRGREDEAVGLGKEGNGPDP